VECNVRWAPRMRFHLLLSAAVSGVVLSAASAANAHDYPSMAPYVGVFGGMTVPLNDWELGSEARASGRVDERLPRLSPGAGLRLGFQIIPQLAVEVAGQWIPLEGGNATEKTGNTAFSYEIAALYHFMPGGFSPYVTIGAGFYTNLSTGEGKLGKDSDPRGHLGLGARGLVTQNIALRLEGRGVVTDGFNTAYNLEVLGGIDFFFAKAKAPVVIEEKVPEAPPDRDKDGVIDAKDKCPDVAGDPALDGCPDKDKDGITDAEDQCPKDPGPKELNGCPDKDKDGIADIKDKCPDVPGEAAFEGCPDTDKDGVTDAEDRCPKDAGLKELKGCPDRDSDKVADIDDKCPDQAGLPELQGCLPDVAKKFAGAIKGINFKFGSAEIQANSFKLLDEAAKVLTDYPTLKLRITGHTDNVGKPDKNLKLSEDRAASVKAYLKKKGIDESRLDSKGHGDTKPVQDNKTDAGRAANRRIEFEIVTQ